MLFHLIDDQPVICEYLASVIEKLGHDASQFHSPADYLNYLNNNDYVRPDVIFTDVYMWKISGPEVIGRVRSIYPDQRFVIISGRRYPVENDMSDDRCLFLNKPFTSHQIENVVRTIGLSAAA